MKNQTYNWGSESDRYTLKAIKSKNHPNDNQNKYIYDQLKKFFKNKKISSILDVGCGGGKFLNSLNLKTRLKKCGIETSSKSINVLKKKHKKCTFIKSHMHNIPLKDNSFDFVYAISVLHWVDRNNYLQSLGELLRVSKKFLMIVDFSPKEDYYLDYKHKKNFFTFKQNFHKILSNSGILKKKIERNWYIDGQNNLNTFKKINNISKINPLNHHLRKLIIYEKKITLKKKKFISLKDVVKN